MKKNFFVLETDDKDIVKKDKSELGDLCLFHIALSRRYLVSNSRFNISGFPCLYASDSLELALKETMIYNNQDKILLDRVNFAKYSNSLDIRIYDFSLTDFNVLFKSKPLNFVLSYLTLFPLIISLHTKLDYCEIKRVNFRQEYIIPNLLLSWLINKRYLDLNGINRDDSIYYLKYSSVRVLNSNYYNYIFYPTDIQNGVDHCEKLKTIFIHDQSKFYYSDELNRGRDCQEILSESNIEDILAFYSSLL